ncbi:MAG: hypothetical protein K2Y37_26255 [Pirellulales bacterium]|nr:hypothetical protein [Pirellulales bacterium]
MKRSLIHGLVLSLTLVYCGAIVWARGGHGGGHGGHHGGHHSGHHGHAGHHGHPNHHPSHHANHHAHWAHHNRPFSRGWYAGHRGAWGGGWGWGNPWAVAGWGPTAAWLGLNAAAGPAWGGYGPTNTTIYDTDNEALNQPGAEFAGGQNLSPDALAAESAAAGQLAAQGATEPGQNEKFMPLGVFTLAPENQTEATAMLQLAVSKQGVVRGTYFDLLSDTDHPVRGAVDKQTQRVAWIIGPQGKVTFQTGLAVLTEPSGPVSVHYQNGQTRQWVLARYEKEPSETDPAEDESGEAGDAADAGDDKNGDDQADDK